MKFNHDIDALVLLAVMLAAKRRPADLAGIVAAADLVQGFVPLAAQLDESIRRLSAQGLIVTAEDGLGLGAAAQALIAGHTRRATTDQMLATFRDQLANYRAPAEYPAVEIPREQLSAAVRAHRAAKQQAGPNLLMPKPKADRHFKVAGRWRRAPARNSDGS